MAGLSSYQSMRAYTVTCTKANMPANSAQMESVLAFVGAIRSVPMRNNA